MPEGYVFQIHLNHSTLPTAIPLHDSYLNVNSLKLGDVEYDILRRDGEVAVVVIATVALTLFITFAPCSLSQLLCLNL